MESQHGLLYHIKSEPAILEEDLSSKPLAEAVRLARLAALLRLRDWWNQCQPKLEIGSVRNKACFLHQSLFAQTVVV